MKNLLFVISMFEFSALASVDRIQAMRFDRSAVKEIYLAPGMGSMIQFPCALLEVFVGRNQDLKVQISPNEKKTLFLNLKLNASLPTNVIARCEGERNSYVFDVVPSRTKHQDVVEIRSSFGGPGLRPARNDQKNAISKNLGRVVIKQPVLVEKGGVK